MLGFHWRTGQHALAAHLAARFPEELGFRLPPKRKAYMSEDSQMDMATYFIHDNGTG
jgi:hypothetical protein